jgi:hypothetical protein
LVLLKEINIIELFVYKLFTFDGILIAGKVQEITKTKYLLKQNFNAAK